MQVAHGFFMIRFLSIEWFYRRLWGRSMAVFLPGVILVLALFVAGCGKSKPAPVQVSTPPPTIENTNPAPTTTPMAATPVPTQAVIPASPDGGADLKQLNHIYVGWVLQNRRRPQSFDEFVKLSGIQVPPPPAGKKYVIDGHGFINYAKN
jgi:hypothetical protein